MGKLTLHNCYSSDLTIISNVFLDYYMPEANGEFVKIYLYLLRASSKNDSPFTLSLIADTFDCTEKDILRALRYWKKVGVLDLSFSEDKKLEDISFLPLKKPAAEIALQTEVISQTAAACEVTVPPAAALDDTASSLPKKTALTADRVKKLKENEEIVQLLFITEQYLGKTLSPTETKCILYFYEELHFSANLIEYLIEYCVSKGSRSIRYIETVALAWAEQKITTVAMAKKETTTYNKHYFSILKAFGIKNRNPIEQEVKYMDTWLNNYGFSLDIIGEACSRTILQVNQPSFAYAERILSHWSAQGVKHLSDIDALDIAHKQAKAEKATTASAKEKAPTSAAKNKFNNFHQREYDANEINELEKQLLNQ